MYAITQGDLEKAIYDLENYFKVDFNGMTNRECIAELRKLCPKLHTTEELMCFSERLLENIEQKYGFLGLRVWYRVVMAQAIFGHDMMHEKYYKLIKEISAYINDYREKQEINLLLDVYLASIFVKEIYKKKFGVLTENLNDTHSILRTIHLMDYEEDIVDKLNSLLEFSLHTTGDKYYIKKNLKDSNVLRELYVYVCEEIGDDDVYKGHKLFYDYDGYGNVYMDI